MAHGDINPEYTNNSVPTLDTFMVGLMIDRGQGTVRKYIKEGKLQAKRHIDGTWRVSALSVAELTAQRNGEHRVPFGWVGFASDTVETAREQAERLAVWSGDLAPRMLLDAEGNAERLYSPNPAELAHHAKVLDSFKAQ